MNKTELIDAIAKDSGLSRADSARAIDSLVNTVQKTLRKGDEVAVTGFGKFSVAKRGARTGRNPQTGQPPKDSGVKGAEVHGGGDFQSGGERKEEVGGDEAPAGSSRAEVLAGCACWRCCVRVSGRRWITAPGCERPRVATPRVGRSPQADRC